MDLALFDLDETLICADSTGLWLRWLESQGFAGKELLQQEQRLMQSYYQGTLAIEDYMYLSLSPLIGLSAETVSAWVDRFIRRDILPALPGGARADGLAPPARRYPDRYFRQRRASGAN